MATTSKIHGLMIEKREIYIYNVKEFVPVGNVSQDHLLETLKLLKRKTQEVKLEMNKNTPLKLSKNMGIRKNVNFAINLALETDIVTKTDDEGSKEFIVRSENPFESNFNYIADDKDFFTEQTEDEDEFREISGFETNKRERTVRKNEEDLLNKTFEKDLQISRKRTKKETNLTKSPKKKSIPPGKFSRNIFANFQPTGKMKITQFDLYQPYFSWVLVKNPCRYTRTAISSQIFHEITGRKIKRKKLGVRIVRKKQIEQKTAPDLRDLFVNTKNADIKVAANPFNPSTAVNPSTSSVIPPSARLARRTTTTQDLTNTFFVRAETSSEDTSQIF